jgi:hypothetical protein
MMSKLFVEEKNLPANGEHHRRLDSKGSLLVHGCIICVFSHKKRAMSEWMVQPFHIKIFCCIKSLYSPSGQYLRRIEEQKSLCEEYMLQ